MYVEMTNLLEYLGKNEKYYDLARITEAYEYADKLHEGQMRLSGEPYISHPVSALRRLLSIRPRINAPCFEGTDLILYFFIYPNLRRFFLTNFFEEFLPLRVGILHQNFLARVREYNYCIIF